MNKLKLLTPLLLFYVALPTWGQDATIHSTWTKVNDNVFIDTNRDNITHKDGFTLSYVYMKFNPPFPYHTDDNKLITVGAIYYQFEVNCDTGEAAARRIEAIDMDTGGIHSMNNSDKWMHITQEPATDALIAFTNFVCAKVL